MKRIVRKQMHRTLAVLAALVGGENNESKSDTNKPRSRSAARLLIVRAFVWPCVVVAMVLALRGTSVAAVELVAAGGNPTSVAFADDTAYWGERPDELCTSIPGVIKAVTLGRPTRQLLTGLIPNLCNVDPGEIITDGVDLFFGNRGALWRIWVGGSVRTELAPPGSLAGRPAVDGEHVFWSDGYRIRRAAKDGSGADAVMIYNGSFPGNLSRGSLAVSPDPGCCVFWLESEGSGINLKRHAKTPGGDPDVILSGLPLSTNMIAVDGSYVYFSGAGGEINRVLWTGVAPPEELHPPEAGYIVTSLITDATHVYWAEDLGGSSGRIRRVPKAGGAVETIAAGLSGEHSLNADESYVYFGQSGGVFRVLKNASAEGPDLSWLDIEVTQAIRSLDFELGGKLIEGKPTFVRAYPRSAPFDAGRTTALLHGTKDGVELPGSPVSPFREPNFVSTRADIKRYKGQSFDFLIPTEWTEGSFGPLHLLSLRAEINPGGLIPEPDTSNNSITTEENFHTVGPVCLQMLPVRGHAPLYHVADEGFWDIIDRYETLWPARRVSVYAIDAVVEEVQCCHWWGPIPYPYYGPYEFDARDEDPDKVMASLIERRLFTDDPDECWLNRGRSHMVGMLNPSSIHTGQQGYGSFIFHTSWVSMESDPALSDHIPYYVPRGGATLAHETSHNYDGVNFVGDHPWGHVNCSWWGGPPPQLNDSYPYPPCQIAPSFSQTTFWGFDPLTLTPIPPAQSPFDLVWAKDYMSYGKPIWVSDYSWDRMEDELNFGARNPGGLTSQWTAPRAAAEDRLFVLGAVNTVTGRGSITRVYRLTPDLASDRKVASLLGEQAGVLDPEGEFTLELVSDAGGVIASHRFWSAESSQEFPTTSQTFAVAVPYSEGVRLLRITRTGMVVAERSVSGNAPVVAITSPQPGQTLSDPLTIEWTGSDLDGDALVYVIQYSPDGQTWQALVTDYRVTPELPSRLALSVPFLPGSRSPESSRLRVIASDGVNAATATVERLTVPRRSPLAHIIVPRRDARYFHRNPISLRGRGYDPETGSLPDAGLIWRVDGSTVAVGQMAALDGLPPGHHTIELCPADEDGAGPCDSRSIDVTPVREPDDGDLDHIPDETDNCIFAPNPGQEDVDGDGVGDGCDDCPSLYNADQTDTDADLVGDACDPCPGDSLNDGDGDGVCYGNDNCSTIANADQADTDGDGVGDACDNCPDVANQGGADCDEDGIGDACAISRGISTDANQNDVPDECDRAFGLVVEAVIDIRRARVRQNTNRGRPNGEIIVTGDIVLRSGMDRFDPRDGAAVTIKDGIGMHEMYSWDAQHCASRASGRVICRDETGDFTLLATPLSAQVGRLRFRLRLKRRDLAAPFAPSLTMRLAPSPPVPRTGIDRVGAIGTCRITPNGMLCHQR